MLIEFFGRPGSGKTHFCSELLERLPRARSLRAMFSPARFTREWFRSRLGALRWIAAHPSYTLRLRAAIEATGQSSPRDVRRFLRAWIYTMERIVRLRRHCDYLLIDHGFAQLLWSIGFGADPNRWIASLPQFGELLELADLTVVLTVSPDTANERLEQRKATAGATSRVQQKEHSPSDLEDRIATLTQQVRDLILSRRKNGKRVLEIDNNHSDEACESVVRLLQVTRSAKE